MNMTMINVQLTIEAAVTQKEGTSIRRLCDPHCSSELSIDDIVKLCDDLIESTRLLAAEIPLNKIKALIG